MSVRIAFIGAGGIADWQHFDNLETIDDAEIVAVCDIDEETAREAADRFDADAFTDHEAMFADADVDAVFVCLPPFAHEGQERMAAERGVDLFVEKPLGLSTDPVVETAAAIEDAGVLAQVGYNWRYARAVERARELIGDRTVSYVEGWWKSGLITKDWWQVEEMSGGQVVEQATHIYDLVRYFGGDVEEVTAYGGHRIHEEELDFPDVTAATMRHENGVVSHVTSTTTAQQSAVGAQVLAEDADLTITTERLSGVVDGEEIDETFDDNPYLTEVEAFVDAVGSGDASDVRSDYADAARTLALTLAVTESAETGDPVSVSLD